MLEFSNKKSCNGSFRLNELKMGLFILVCRGSHNFHANLVYQNYMDFDLFLKILLNFHLFRI